jgi:hypothetical protein
MPPPGAATSGPLTAVPEITEYALDPESEFIIVGCDGVW